MLGPATVAGHVRMGAMRTSFWERVAASGFAVPADEPLADLTAELTVMLGSPDPHVRQDLATSTLATWIAEGVYDGLLTGLGDGLVAGLLIGLGEDGTESVFRRSFSARLLGVCLDRDSGTSVVGPDTVLRWGDALMSWFVRECDLRGHVPGSGGARAVAHGAGALESLAASASLGELELVAVLDVLADRLTVATTHRMLHDESDRMARCALAVFRRELVSDEILEGWLARLVELTRTRDQSSSPAIVAGNAETFLRALHLQLAIGARPPGARGDLLLAVLAALRASNGELLQ